MKRRVANPLYLPLKGEEIEKIEAMIECLKNSLN